MTKSKKALVRDGRHMRPMLAVLQRGNIGELDTYGRGRWIAESDLPAILAEIKRGRYAMQTAADPDAWGCCGTNIHNWVDFREFKTLFE